MSGSVAPSRAPDAPLRISAVTVYCSASNNLHPDYHRLARDFGARLAGSGRTLIYGGGAIGLMGEVARSARGAGGRVVGIITQRLCDAEQLDHENDENIVVQTMRERKALLEARGDAYIVLPGGIGTLEEFFEILVGRLLGEHANPIIILNCNDPDDERPVGGRYYDPLLRMFDHVIGSRFANPRIRALFDVCETVDEVLEALDRHESATSPRVAVGDALLPSARQ